MSRQGKNIYKRKDGRWEGRYVKFHVNGKAKYGYIYGKTYEDVESRLKQIPHHEMKTEGIANDSFESISKEWLEGRTPELKASSVSKYRNTLNSYLLAQFGSRKITDISRGDVSSFSRELLISGGSKAEGLAPKTVNGILSVMKNIFAYAVREKSIITADIKDISVKQSQKPMRILSIDEQQKLIQYLYDNICPCFLGILLCLYTGLRIGEICALKWKDICVREKYLFVHQTMQRIQIEGLEKKKTKVVIQSPKSDCSIRKIPIPDEMLQMLLPFQVQDEAFLLTGLAHKFVEPRSMENRFKVATRDCCIENVNFHALRHYVESF